MRRLIKPFLILIAAMLLALLVMLALCPKPNPGKPVPAEVEPNRPGDLEHGAR